MYSKGKLSYELMYDCIPLCYNIIEINIKEEIKMKGAKVILTLSCLTIGSSLLTAKVTQDKLTRHYEEKIKGLNDNYKAAVEEHKETIEVMNREFENKLATSVIDAVAQAKQESVNYRVDNFTATAYSPYENVSGMENDGDATATSTGMSPGPNVFAVDPTVIPYYSKMIVIYPNGEILTGVAGDCGGLIKGNKIDVYKHTYKETLQHGVRDCVVVWWE